MGMKPRKQPTHADAADLALSRAREREHEEEARIAWLFDELDHLGIKIGLPQGGITTTFNRETNQIESWVVAPLHIPADSLLGRRISELKKGGV